MSTDTEGRQAALRSQEIVEQIRLLLAGAGPSVQGAVILDLLAIWLAGHHPEARAAQLRELIAVLPRMVEVNEKIMFGDVGFPREGLS